MVKKSKWTTGITELSKEQITVKSMADTKAAVGQELAASTSVGGSKIKCEPLRHSDIEKKTLL